MDLLGLNLIFSHHESCCSEQKNNGEEASAIRVTFVLQGCEPISLHSSEHLRVELNGQLSVGCSHSKYDHASIVIVPLEPFSSAIDKENEEEITENLEREKEA